MVSKFLRLTFVLFSMLLTPHLAEASGWGKTEEVNQFEGVLWNGVYFDMNGLNFIASIPNYAGASMQNGSVSVNGEIDENTGYVIATALNKGFTPPKSLKEFVKIIQDANPDYIIQTVEAKKLGAKYALDLVPKNQADTAFWRFLATKDRLIKMGTDDTNPNRRLYFFESIHID